MTGAITSNYTDAFKSAWDTFQPLMSSLDKELENANTFYEEVKSTRQEHQRAIAPTPGVKSTNTNERILTSAAQLHQKLPDHTATFKSFKDTIDKIADIWQQVSSSLEFTQQCHFSEAGFNYILNLESELSSSLQSDVVTVEKYSNILEQMKHDLQDAGYSIERKLGEIGSVLRELHPNNASSFTVNKSLFQTITESVSSLWSHFSTSSHSAEARSPSVTKTFAERVSTLEETINQLLSLPPSVEKPQRSNTTFETTFERFKDLAERGIREAAQARRESAAVRSDWKTRRDTVNAQRKLGKDISSDEARSEISKEVTLHSQLSEINKKIQSLFDKLKIDISYLEMPPLSIEEQQVISNISSDTKVRYDELTREHQSYLQCAKELHAELEANAYYLNEEVETKGTHSLTAFSGALQNKKTTYTDLLTQFARKKIFRKGVPVGHVAANGTIPSSPSGIPSIPSSSSNASLAGSEGAASYE